MRLGSDVVRIVTVSEDATVRDENRTPRLVRTAVEVRGCRFRPTTSRETKASGGTIVSDAHRLTAPVVSAVLNATSRDEVEHDGTTYQIVGLPRLHTDLRGRPSHVTIEVARTLG